MGCLGVHLALDEDEVNALRTQPSDDARLNYLLEELEELYFGERPERLAESDKAWDAIHRTLTDGKIGWDNGTFPLNHVILGGDVLYGRDDYIMSLKTPAEVRAVAQELSGVSEEDFRKNYFSIDPEDYGFPISQVDFEYTWSWFQPVRDLYFRAAEAGRYVLFTASQ
jgi:hypothetical protein